MRFADTVTFHTIAGHGGPGARTFRKEKYVAMGGPDGGDGGKGGDVVLVADRNIGTLNDLRYRKIIKAKKGAGGARSRRTGKSGVDELVRVPVGTIVRDAHSSEILIDLNEDGARYVVAKGGRGGLGNAHFKTSVTRAPTYSQPGEEGEERTILLELKLLADIGIIGYPSVGKSTLISVISNARPKIAAYHFTTLAPNLGIVSWHSYKSFVVADIPGLVEGASEGRGLGHQFLRHVERCRALLHVIEVTAESEYGDPSGDQRDPIGDFERINKELAAFSPTLAERPQIVALSKMDLPFVREKEPELRAYFEERGYTFLTFSSMTRMDLQPLIDEMGTLVENTEVPDIAEFTVAEAKIPAIAQPPAPTAEGEEDGLDDEDLVDDSGATMVWDPELGVMVATFDDE